ncbi:hypothetical protein WB44_12030 [Synechococcus sp. WH 8020]|nr:hypothetical protein WB44_12030 [Synechococcus sp. WH 8020]
MIGDESVILASMGTRPAALTLQRERDSFSISAHPTNLLCWHPNHKRIRLDISINNSPCSNEGMMAYSNTAYNCAISTKRYCFFNICIPILIFTTNRRTRIIDIREYHTRPTEDIIFERNVVVNRDIILHFDVIANAYLVANEYILPERASASNDGT